MHARSVGVSAPCHTPVLAGRARVPSGMDGVVCRRGKSSERAGCSFRDAE